MAQAIACDIHPLNNLRVRNYLRGSLNQDERGVNAWSRHWIDEGFRGLEELARRYSTDGRHLYGAGVTLADVCLVPQVYNARRVDCDLAAFPTLVAISAALEALPAFFAARPEAQPDAA
jgi:maleylacetoacetate isomerase